MQLNYRRRILACLAVAAATVPLAPRAAEAQSAAAQQPIIDMHFHAPHGPPAETRQKLFQKLDRYHCVLTALFVNDTAGAVWHRIDPDRLFVGAAFPCYGSGGDPTNPCFPEGNGWPDLTWLRAQYQAGQMRLMGELKYVYYGLPPTDPRLEPYWALAENSDIPVGIHSGRGPYVRREGCCPHFNDDLANPALLEPVLARHPNLRIWLMHQPGWDYVDEAIALMKAHPNVYADMSILNSVMPVGQYRAHLKAVADAGLLDRIMFGSDDEPLGPIIERIDAVPFLTEQQKRGIFCENAARFLQLNAEICTPGPKRTPRPRSRSR